MTVGGCANARLTISKMVLENFKSYAGRQEIGPFHKSFSSIVGPNGSGKSNVIDALLFVFGYRAKKMRQGKLCELIHNSKEYPNLEYCTVEIHFEDIIDIKNENGVKNEYQVVEGSQIVISRSATQSNKSIYLINGQNSSFTEVTTLLKGRGVDLDHKRFLILQGEVESISLMKPKASNEHEEGLLEYLEDIIGTNQYQAPIQETGKQLEVLSEEKELKLHRLKIVEKSKESLLAKRNEAQTYLSRENDLVRKQHLLFQILGSVTERNIQNYNQKIQSNKSTLEAEREKYSKKVEELKAAENEYALGVKEYEILDDRANEALKEMSKFERENIQLSEKKKHFKTKVKKLGKSIQTNTAEISTKTSTIKALELEAVNNVRECAVITENLAAEESVLDEIRQSLKGKTDVFQMELEKTQKELAPYSAKILQKEGLIQISQSELNILNENLSSLDSQVQGKKKELLENNSLLDEKISSVKKKKLECSNIEKVISKASERVAELNEQHREIEEKLNSCKVKLEENKFSAQQNSSRGSILSSLMNEKKCKRIKGIYGRLGDLGVIDEKYDVAISTACSSLDSIVVDTTLTAQQCIEFLRKNNLGRATFIVLDKQAEPKSMSTVPNGALRLFDLIKAKEESFRKAFYYALRDTLVTDSLEVANKVAYGPTRFRVVTLDGKLIDASGTMSGGGNKLSKGGMKSIFSSDLSAKEVEVLEKEYKGYSETISLIEKESSEYKLKISQLESLLESSKHEISKEEMFMKQLTENKANVEQCLQELEANRKVSDKNKEQDKARVIELEKVIKVEQTEIQKISKSCASIEAKINELQEKILEIGGVKLKTQQSKVNNLKDQKETLELRLSKITLEKVATEKSIEKLRNAVEKEQKELQEIETSLDELDNSIKEKTEASNLVRELCNEAKKICEDRKEKLDGLKKKIDKQGKTVNEFRAFEVNLNSEIEDMNKQLDELKKQAKSWTNKMDNLKLQDLDFETESELKVLKVLPLEEIEELREEQLEKQLQQEIQEIQEYLTNTKINVSVLGEFKEKENEYLALLKDTESFIQLYEQTKEKYETLCKTRFDEFMTGFTIISQKLKEMYQMITLGGNAELELVDSLDPFSEGIIFSVMPPKKSWKNISNLSGGEKTLSSLSLVFALHHYKPTPLYVMDEIDAALDFRNVSIVANYIKERTENAQFIIISLRNNMFEMADRLVGIYKTNNCTKSITLSLAQ